MGPFFGDRTPVTLVVTASLIEVKGTRETSCTPMPLQSVAPDVGKSTRC